MISTALRRARSGDLEQAVTAAREGARRLVELRAGAHGPNDQEIVVALHVLADLELEQMALTDAVTTLDLARTLATEQIDTHLLAETLTRRGNALRLRAMCEAAEEDLTAAVRLVDDESAARVRALNALGILCKDTGRLDDAEAHYEAARELLDARFPQEPQMRAAVLHNLAGLAHARGCYAEGERLIRLALEQRRQAPGRPDAVADLQDRGVLAALIAARGGYVEAEAHLLDLVAAWTSLRGREHYEVAFCHHHLGKLREDQGDPAGAREHYAVALAGKRDVLGPLHPEVGEIEGCLRRLGPDTACT